MEMSDWQVGDLALCIKLGPWVSRRYGFERPNQSARPQPGRIYTVEAVEVVDGLTFLILEGITTTDGGLRSTFNAARFRKIPPHTRDAEDDETIRLLTGAPVLEPTAITAWRERWNEIEEEV